MIRTIVARAFIIVVTLGAGALFILDWHRLVAGGTVHWTSDATIRAAVTPLQAHVQGYVADVPVADYAKVAAGQPVVRLEDGDYRSSLEQASAQLAARQAAVEVLAARSRQAAAQVDVAEAQVTVARAEVVRTERDKARRQQLQGTPAANRRLLDDADAAATAAAEQMAAREHEVEAARRSRQSVEAQLRAAQADVQAAGAERDQAALQLEWTHIKAPEAGTVTARGVHEGQLVEAGMPVTSFVGRQKWVIANFREDELAEMRPGQPARVQVDAYPDLELHGRVDAVGPASQARSAPVAPRRDVGTFTRIVQRIPVRISLDADPALMDRLRPGMNVRVGIDTAAGATARQGSP